MKSKQNRSQSRQQPHFQKRKRAWRGKRESLTVFQLLRDPEIGNLDPSLIVDENIGTLDIPMDDPPFVHVVETLEDLAQEIAHERFFECAVVAQ